MQQRAGFGVAISNLCRSINGRLKILCRCLFIAELRFILRDRGQQFGLFASEAEFLARSNPSRKIVSASLGRCCRT